MTFTYKNKNSYVNFMFVCQKCANKGDNFKNFEGLEGKANSKQQMKPITSYILKRSVETG